MYYSTKSIILKTYDLKDADKIVSFFSESEGKVRAVARGVKKPRSSLRACVQPFCHSQLSIKRGRELDLITQGKIIDFYGNSREDVRRMLYSVYILELLDKTLMERLPDKELYHITLAVLQDMNDFGYNSLLIRFFEMRLLMSQGYKPELSECTLCGNKSNSFKQFSIANGGAVCAECAGKCGNLYLFSGETLGLLRLLLNTRPEALRKVKCSPAAEKQLENFLELYLEYYFERRFNTKKIIKNLKQRMQI